jgi:hypothetical protein
VPLATATAAVIEPVPLPTALPQLAPAQLTERRLAVLEWPAIMRVGDGDTLRLTLELDAQGQLTPVAEVEGHAVEGQSIEIPNLYDTHNLVAEARLDLAGMQISPQGSLSEPMRPGRKLVFEWSIRAPEVGQYRGTLWLYLNLVAKDGGETERQTLLAPRVEIEARTILGLPAKTVRMGGMVGSGLSVVMGLPFLEKLLEAFWRRLRRRT